jgi:putative ABC transport system permease protein
MRSAIGGAAGVGLAYFMVRAARAWFATSVPRIGEASIDPSVVAMSVMISLIAGIAFGMAPSLRAARSDGAAGLRDGGRGIHGSLSRDRVRRALIVTEIALSFMLLATAGLLGRSFAKLFEVPRGFDASHLVVGSTWLPSSRYPDSLSQRAFYGQLVRDVSAAAGGAPVALASDVPTTSGTTGSVQVQGAASGDSMAQFVSKRIVGPSYFGVVDAHIISGRSFLSTDGPGSPRVVVVNESFANTVFPHEPAVGKRVGFSWGVDGWQTVVGVVADLHEDGLDQPSRPAVYISSEQRPNSSMYIVVRTSLPAGTVGTILRAALHRTDPRVPLVSVRAMPEIVSAGVRQRRLTLTVLGVFAVAALLLAAVGLYGVISYSVAQRSQELGVRLALGAQRFDLVWLVIGEAAVLALAGIAIGSAGAIASRRLMAAQLFGIGPNDPATLALAAVGLALVALAAAAVPTIRAAYANPLDALRAD